MEQNETANIIELSAFFIDQVNAITPSITTSSSVSKNITGLTGFNVIASNATTYKWQLCTWRIRR